MNLVERRDATLTTVERFKDKRFNWAKASTCVHLARTQLAALGHRVPPVPSFRSALSARRALSERGWSNLADMMGAVPTVVEIAPSQALIGDVLELPSEPDSIGSLVVAIGNGRVLGWLEGADDALIMQPDIYARAWRL